MFDVGQVCVKLAGREAGKKCVIVKKVDKNFVMIDGDVKRRKCNVDHLLALNKTLDLKSGASTEAAVEALIKAGLITKKVKAKVKEAKKKQAKPKHAKKASEKTPGEAPKKKAPAKKAAKEPKKEASAKKAPAKKAAKKAPAKK